VLSPSEKWQPDTPQTTHLATAETKSEFAHDGPKVHHPATGNSTSASPARLKHDTQTKHNGNGRNEAHPNVPAEKAD
jgi:hypothetical protein